MQERGLEGEKHLSYTLRLLQRIHGACQVPGAIWAEKINSRTQPATCGMFRARLTIQKVHKHKRGIHRTWTIHAGTQIQFNADATGVAPALQAYQ